MQEGSKAAAAIKRLLEVWESGQMPDYVQRSVIRRQANSRPSDSWSLGNQILMMLTGTQDARGFRQWEQAGRHVTKGAKAIFILAPSTHKVSKTDPATNEPAEALVITGFRGLPVFPVECTEGAPVKEPDYSPAQLPPLADLAEAWGLVVTYSPFSGLEYGSYSPTADRITLRTHEELTFFHELAHAAQKRLGTIKRGQVPSQEIVAETAAAALCLLYGFTPDYQSSARSYVAHYAGLAPDQACKAVMGALSEIQSVLDLILTGATKEDEQKAAS